MNESKPVGNIAQALNLVYGNSADPKPTSETPPQTGFLKLEGGTLSVVHKKGEATSTFDVINHIQSVVIQGTQTSNNSALNVDDLKSIKTNLATMRTEVLGGAMVESTTEYIVRILRSLCGCETKKDIMLRNIDTIQDVLFTKIQIATVERRIEESEKSLQAKNDDLQRLHKNKGAVDTFVVAKNQGVSQLRSGVSQVKNYLGFGNKSKETQSTSSQQTTSQNQSSARELSVPEQIKILKQEIEDLRKSLAADKGELELLKSPKKTTATISYKLIALFGLGIGQKQKFDDVCKGLNLSQEDMDSIKITKDIGSDNSKNITYVEDLHVVIPGNSTATHAVQKTLETSHAVLEEINGQTTAAPNVTKDAGIVVTNKLKEMKPGETLFLPIGTTTHGTLLAFRKMDTGKIAVTYYNTGEGSEDNPSSGILKPGTTKVAFDPVSLDNHGFSTLVSKLYQMSSDPSTTMSDVNGILFPKKKSDDQVFVHPKAAGTKRNQIDGTCTFSSLLLGIEDVITSAGAHPEAIASYERSLHQRVAQDVAKSIDDMAIQSWDQSGKPLKIKRTTPDLFLEYLLNKHNEANLAHLGTGVPKPAARTSGSPEADLRGKVANKRNYEATADKHRKPKQTDLP